MWKRKVLRTPIAPSLGDCLAQAQVRGTHASKPAGLQFCACVPLSEVLT